MEYKWQNIMMPKKRMDIKNLQQMQWSKELWQEYEWKEWLIQIIKNIIFNAGVNYKVEESLERITLLLINT